jgi:hypothetical protein
MGPGSSREELIAAARQYISEQRGLTETELNKVRSIVGYKAGHLDGLEQ